MPAIRPLARCAIGLTLALAALHSAQAACYIVRNAQQEVIYRAQQAPVDMTQPLHETLPRIAPGASLVFSVDSNGCEREIDKLPGAQYRQAVTSQPASLVPVAPPAAVSGKAGGNAPSQAAAPR